MNEKVKLTLISTLILFIPYFIFNSGVVFELAKLEPSGFIDVPYSIALSGHRVDIAALFDKEDAEAVEWLDNHIKGETTCVYSDANGIKLLIQQFGVTMDMSIGSSLTGLIRALERMKDTDSGYIFLRKWNVVNDMLTINGEYASRESYPIDNWDVVSEKIKNGTIIFDNGARIIKVE